MSQATDDHLIEQTRQGDREAFGELNYALSSSGVSLFQTFVRQC